MLPARASCALTQVIGDEGPGPVISYTVLKHIHVTAVVISITLFVLRGGLMLAGSERLEARVLRVLPHVVDTVLLASAVGLVITLEQYPFVHDWLTVKTLALVAYIVFGSIALRRGRTRSSRICALVLALGSVGFIVSVALTRDPLGVFAILR